MMKEQVSRRDLEKLSAYLDEQLNSKQRTLIDARLRDEPDLVEALSSIRQTRLILRATPRLKVPHNFSLTPEMVGQRFLVRNQSYARFRMASVLATFLFVFVVAGDLIGLSNRFAAPELDVPQIIALQKDEVSQPMAELEVPAAVAVEAFDLESQVTEPYTLEVETNAVAEIYGRSSDEDTAPKVPEEAEEFGENMPEAIVEGGEAVIIEGVQTPEDEAPVLMEAAPAEKSIGTTSDEVAPGPVGDVADSAGSVETTVDGTLGVGQDEIKSDDDVIHQGGEWFQDGEINQKSDSEPDLPRFVDKAPSSGRFWFLILEMLLGFIALGTGLVAFYLYRRGNNAG